MRVLRRAKPGKRDDSGVADRGYRCGARSDRLSVHMHCASPTLREAAAKMRVVQPDIVAQRVEQRHIRIGIDGMCLAVHVEGELPVHDRATSWSFASGPD